MDAHRSGPPERFYNGIRFHALTRDAYRNVCQRLIEYGNVLSEPHMDGLMFQAGLFTLKAQNRLPGRHQVTLAPGVGKTEGVIAWVKALVDRGHDHVGVAVAASKVEELAVIKRKLLAAGVAPERVGLRHEYKYDAEVARQFLAGERDELPEGYASEPDEGHERQVLLITHARIMLTRNPDTYRLFRRTPRMVIYDEALVKSKATAIPLVEIELALDTLTKKYGRTLNATGEAAHGYLAGCFAAASEAHQRANETGSGQVIELPPLPEGYDLSTFKAALPRDYRMEPLRALLDVAPNELKVVEGSNGTGGLVTYNVVIPTCLNNVAILDASYPVRDLVQRDRGIVPGEQDPSLRAAFAGELDIASMDLSKIKRYDHCVIHQMRVAGGRTAMTRDFYIDPKDVRQEDSKVCMEIADVVKAIPPEQAVLIFTFKDRNGVKFKGRILDTLASAGVDIHETVNVRVGRDRVETRKRINVLHWGQETAINDYAHCEHVILAGVIRRDRLELEGAILGQEDDGLSARDVVSKDVNNADLGEVLHSIYQALNRGSCRVMEAGEAKPMTAWVMHKHRNIRDPLSRIMPGIRWQRWKPNHFPTFEGSTEDVAEKIAEHLRQLPETVSKISSRRLRSDLGMSKGQPAFIADRTWTRARKMISELVPWETQGQSLVRLF